MKEFFSDIAFILSLAWKAHKSLVVGLGLVRTLGAVIPSVQVYIGKLIVDRSSFCFKTGHRKQCMLCCSMWESRYEGRIREQIGYGEIESMEDLKQIQKAARISGPEPFIEELPKRHETPLGKWELGEGTAKLSREQWQRLALARACIKRHAALLILDEPSAALDTEAEAVFFEQLLREIQDKSIIFISHRFSTVRRADQILSLRRGRVNEYGTHEELTQRNGRYAELFRMQARWYG